jgi:hypothetical protein
MPRRLWLILFLSLVTALGVSWVRWGVPRVERRLHAKALSVLSAKLGKPVRLDAVHLHPLFLAVGLENLQVLSGEEPGAPPLFACRRWTLFLTPIHRAQRFPWFSLSFGKSRVETPVVRLDALPRGARPARSSPFLSLLPAHRLEWEDASFHFPAVGKIPSFSLGRAAGSAVMTGGSLALETEGETFVGKLRVAFRAAEPIFARDKAAAWKAVVIVPGADLAQLSALLPADAPGEWSGRADVSVTVQGDFSGKPPKDWAAGLVFRDAAWNLDRRPWPLAGRLDVSPAALQMDLSSLDGALRAEGSLQKPFSPEGRWDMGVTFKAFPLEALRGRLPLRLPSSLAWRGTAEGELTLKGPRSDPEAALDLRATDAGATPFVFPSIRASLETTPEARLFKASLADGSLWASLPRAGGGDSAWEAHAEGISLDVLAEAGGWGPVGGLLRADFAFRRSPEGGPLAGGQLRVDTPAWGDHRLEAPLVAFFSWKEGSLKLHNKDGTLDAALEDAAGGAKKLHFAYSRADGLFVQGSGSVGPEGRDLSFDGSAGQASLRDLPFLLNRYPDIAGRWQAELSARGTLAAPVLSGAFSGGGARLHAAAPPHAFQGRFHWEAGALRLEDVSLDGSLSASALRLADGQTRVSLTAQGADPALIREVLLSTAPAGGRLSGRLDAEWGGGEAPVGAFQAALVDGLWGETSIPSAGIRLKWEDGRAALEELTWGHPGGTLRYQGEARRGPGGKWPFRLEGSRLGEIRGLAAWGNGRLTVDGVGAGEGVTASARVDFKARALSARLLLRRAPAGALWSRAGLPAPPPEGVLDGEAVLEGPFQDPRGRIGVRWSRAALRGSPVEASLRALWRPGLLTLEEARLETGESGLLKASGDVPLSRTAGWGLAWEAEDMPVSLIVSHLKGRLRGKGAVSGPREAPEGSFSVGAAGVALGDFPPFRLDAQGDVRAGVVTFRKAEAAGDDGVWRLRPGSTVKVLGEGVDFSLRNDLRNVQLGPVSLFGGLRVEGAWRKSSPPRLTLTASGEDLWINQQPVDGVLASLSWSEGKVLFDPPAGAAGRLEGGIDLAAWPQVRFVGVSIWDGVERRLRADGEIGPGPWNFSVEGHGLDTLMLLSLADLEFSAEGAVDALLTGAGSAAHPRVEADISGRDGRLLGIPYDRVAATLLWDGPRVEIRSFEASRRRGYVLSGRGDVEAAPRPGARPKVNAHARLTDGNLAILKDLWADCREAAGPFEGELSVVPGPDGPRVSGFLELRNGSFKAGKYVTQVSDLDVRLRLAESRVTVEAFSGRSGKGRFVGEGRLDLDGFGVGEYDLAFRTVGKRGVQVEIPQLSVPPGPLFKRFSVLRRTLEAPSQGRPRFDLKVTGPQGAHKVSGEIVLEDTHFTYPPAKGAFRGTGGPSAVGDFFRDALWELRLKTGEDTWYRNEFVNVRVNGAVDVEGPRNALRVDGKISANQGVINYLSQPFELRRALLELYGGDRDPGREEKAAAYISGEAEKTATTLDNQGTASLDVITMIIPRAPLEEIRPRFVSRNNPSLSSERVFQRMMGFSGRDNQQQPTPEEQEQLQRAALVQLVGASASPLANRLARLFGIDMISTLYEPDAPDSEQANFPSDAALRPGQAGGRTPGRWSELLRGAGATAGVQLTDRLFGLYKFKVDQSIENQVYLHDEVQIVGRLRGNLYLKFSSELDTRSLLGQPPNRQAMLEQRWRFGLPKRKPAPATTTEGSEKKTP